MLRLFLATIAGGAATIAATGAAVALLWDVSWGDGIGAVCVVGSVVGLAIAFGGFVRWVVVGRSGLALRAVAAGAFVSVLLAALWIEVRWVAYDGCNHSWGDQPMLTVPISLVTEEPVAEDDVLFNTAGCGRYAGRAYEVGPFGEVP